MQHASHTACEVGRTYLVPCLLVTVDGCPDLYGDGKGWVPVIGPKHEDAEALAFPYQHFHIDWRFVSARAFAYATRWSSSPHGHVITTTEKRGGGITRAPVLKRRRCQRQMPDFPARPANVTRGAPMPADGRWARLELAQAFICNRLKPGNVCPHRGIDLTPFARPDGTAICPGHGLRWDLATGELMPRHAAGA